MNRIIIYCLLIITLFATYTRLYAGDALLVYIDYAESDNLERYLRSEISFVGYARDPALADVHILITDQKTGKTQAPPKT